MSALFSFYCDAYAATAADAGAETKEAEKFMQKYESVKQICRNKCLCKWLLHVCVYCSWGLCHTKFRWAEEWTRRTISDMRVRENKLNDQENERTRVKYRFCWYCTQYAVCIDTGHKKINVQHLYVRFFHHLFHSPVLIYDVKSSPPSTYRSIDLIFFLYLPCSSFFFCFLNMWICICVINSHQILLLFHPCGNAMKMKLMPCSVSSSRKRVHTTVRQSQMDSIDRHISKSVYEMPMALCYNFISILYCVLA